MLKELKSTYCISCSRLIEFANIVEQIEFADALQQTLIAYVEIVKKIVENKLHNT